MSKLEELKRLLDEANANATREDDAHEERALELELEYTKKLGARGRKWEIFRTTEGPFVVVRGDGLHFKKYQGALGAEGVLQHEISLAQRAFALEQTAYPDRERAEELFNAAPGLVVRLETILVRLHRAEETSRVGKP